jgi:hypothetical protein
MNHFWTSLFGHLKGCGRNATLFIATLVLLFVLLIAGAAIWETPLRDYLWPVPCLIAAGSLYWFYRAYRAIREWGARRRERLGQSRLSDDELRVAIGKLGRGRNTLLKPPPRHVKLPPATPF